jgi:pilus assembly protein TadC
LYSKFTITQAWINTYFFKREVLLSKKEYTRFKVLVEKSVHLTNVLLIIFCSWDFLLCVFFTYPMSTVLFFHSAIWHSFTLLLF